MSDADSSADRAEECPEPEPEPEQRIVVYGKSDDHVCIKGEIHEEISAMAVFDNDPFYITVGDGTIFKLSMERGYWMINTITRGDWSDVTIHQVGDYDGPGSARVTHSEVIEIKARGIGWVAFEDDLYVLNDSTDPSSS
jgi:hypothetical protein